MSREKRSPRRGTGGGETMGGSLPSNIPASPPHVNGHVWRRLSRHTQQCECCRMFATPAAIRRGYVGLCSGGGP